MNKWVAVVASILCAGLAVATNHGDYAEIFLWLAVGIAVFG